MLLLLLLLRLLVGLLVTVRELTDVVQCNVAAQCDRAVHAVISLLSRML